MDYIYLSLYEGRRTFVAVFIHRRPMNCYFPVHVGIVGYRFASACELLMSCGVSFDVVDSITSQAKRLNASLSSLSHFESDLREFLLWLTKTEAILMHHEEMTVADSCCTDSEQQWTKLEQSFWVRTFPVHIICIHVYRAISVKLPEVRSN